MIKEKKYKKIICNLEKKYKFLKTQIFGVELFATDKEGVLLYSSTQTNNYENYIKGHIKFDNVKQSKVLQIAKQNSKNSMIIQKNNVYIGNKNGIGLSFTRPSLEEIINIINCFLNKIKNDKEYMMLDGNFQKKKTEDNYANLRKYYGNKFLKLIKYLGVFQKLNFSVLDDNLKPFLGYNNSFENYKENKVVFKNPNIYNSLLQAMNKKYDKSFINNTLTISMKCGQGVSVQTQTTVGYILGGIFFTSITLGEYLASLDESDGEQKIEDDKIGEDKVDDADLGEIELIESKAIDDAKIVEENVIKDALEKSGSRDVEKVVFDAGLDSGFSIFDIFLFLA